MAGKYANDDEPISEINVIPLVDIILVVLIIFMVTAPLVMKPTIDINLPKASSGEESKLPSTMAVTITTDGRYMFNGELVTVAQIQDRAQAIVLSDPDTPAILMADKGVTLEILTEVVDAIRNAGVKRVAFSIDKK